MGWSDTISNENRSSADPATSIAHVRRKGSDEAVGRVGGGAYMERKRLVTGFGEYLQRGGDGTELPTIQLKNRTYPLTNIFNLTHSPIFFLLSEVFPPYIFPLFLLWWSGFRGIFRK